MTHEHNTHPLIKKMCLCYYPHMLRESVSPICGILSAYIHFSVLCVITKKYNQEIQVLTFQRHYFFFLLKLSYILWSGLVFYIHNSKQPLNCQLWLICILSITVKHVSTKLRKKTKYLFSFQVVRYFNACA